MFKNTNLSSTTDAGVALPYDVRAPYQTKLSRVASKCRESVSRAAGVMRFSVSVGGAYMNINESPGHARGTENFSSLSARLMKYFK